MKKNNFVVGYLAFGVLLGLWGSIGIITYLSIDFLIALSLLGVAICFLGFIHYWTKTNNLQETLIYKNGDGGDKGSKSIVKKDRVWKR